MINVALIGGSGYSGKELIRLLLQHPEVKIKSIFAKSTAGKNINDIYPFFKKKIDIVIDSFDISKIKDIDLIFAALPHGESMEILPKLIGTNIKVIDLGGDFRFQDVSIYEKWYKKEHIAKNVVNHFVYGLPELFRDKIKKANYIANPGCYPTSAILALAPIVNTDYFDLNSIVINSLSGVSGAGRKATIDYSFCEVNESVKAYKIGNHQHSPEIETILNDFSGKKINLIFVPHLIPVNRGIYTTIYLKPKVKIDIQKVRDIYNNYYKNSLFVRLFDSIPQLQDVVYTNFCDIALTYAEDSNFLVINSAIDNLIKGAAGQAIQNMNIMFNLKEDEGLNGN